MRSTERALIPEPTLAACDGVCPRAGAAQAARCGPGSRVGALGGGCGSSPSCMRIFSITGHARMAAMMLTRREAAGRERLQLAGTACSAFACQ